jgi:hypothetical protein
VASGELAQPGGCRECATHKEREQEGADGVAPREEEIGGIVARRAPMIRWRSYGFNELRYSPAMLLDLFKGREGGRSESVMMTARREIGELGGLPLMRKMVGEGGAEDTRST